MKQFIGAFLLVGMLASINGVQAARPDGDGPWADLILSVAQGTDRAGNPLVSPNSDPWDALGVAESSKRNADPAAPETGSYFSLGYGGQITLGFTNPIVNGEGADFKIYQVTNAPDGRRASDEAVNVEVSNDGFIWTMLAEGVSGSAELDLGDLSSAVYLQLTDVSDGALSLPTEDGYNLDGVAALHQGTKRWRGAVKKLSYWQRDGIIENNSWDGHTIRAGNICQRLWNQAIAFQNNWNLDPEFNGVSFREAGFNTFGKKRGIRLYDGTRIEDFKVLIDEMTCIKGQYDKRQVEYLIKTLSEVNNGKYLVY